MSDPIASELRPIFVKLPTAQIVLIKAVIESYEGLAEVRTLDAEKGEIVFLALPDTEADVRALVQSLTQELQCREIPMPDDLSGDWLLAEMAQNNK